MIEPKKETGIHGRTLWVIAGTVLLVLAGAITWFFQKRRKGRLKPRKLESKQQRSVDEMFADASLLVHGEDKSFYSSLHGAIWEFFQQRLNISGSGMNKEELFMHMKKRGIDILTITAIRNILQQCEEGMFTTASLSVNKSRMLEQARELVKQVENLF